MVANTLADADGLGSISYQWQAAGVDITGANNNSFTLTQAQVGKAITVVARYNDAFGNAESVTSGATAEVVNVNDAPTGVVTITGIATQGQTLTALNTLADADGLGTISYQWQAAGVNIVGANNNSFTLAQAQVSKTITVVASYTDAFGNAESVTSGATAEIANVNDTPAANDTSVSGSEDTPFIGTVIATDLDGDSLTYTAVTPPAHGTIVLNPDGTYTYTPAANYSGTDSFTFKANDGTLNSNTATVSITVTPVNDAPVLANALADRSVTLGSILNFAFADNTFTDVDSPSLTYTAKLANGAALPSWLSFNPASRAFSGTPGAADLGTLTVQVTASDGALSVADTFDLVISERPNTSPTASNTSVNTKEDTPLTGTLPGATDAEGDPVTYAKASDPAKGTVSVGASGAFTYTPAANANGDDSFTYTVTDDRGASSTYTVSLTITPVNDAPEITPLAPLAFVDTAQSDVFVLEQTGQIQAQDIDSVQLSYHISGGTNVGAYSTVQGTYGSLQLHTGTGAYTFFANNAAIQALKSNASETFTFTVSDGALTAEAPMSVQITGANDAPVLIAPLSDQTAYDASAWSLTLSDTHFSDADTGDVLSYSASLDDGGALPSWLSFDPATRTFSGTPGSADVGQLAITVTATDLDQASATDTFILTITEVNIIYGSDTSETLTGSEGTDRVDAGPGDDRIEGLAGDDILNGGNGIDTAVYTGSAAQYTIRIDRVNGTATVTDFLGQRDGTDSLTGIERLQFGDQTFELLNPARTTVPKFGQANSFLFDPSYYLLSNPDLANGVTMDTAFAHYISAGAEEDRQPNAWFDPVYYASRWDDLKTLNLSPDVLFQHYNLYGVWEGRSAGPMYDRYDGNRYLEDNPDVAAYVDAYVADFLGSRTNGAVAHYLIYGANEGRVAYDLDGSVIPTDFTIEAALVGVPE